MRPIFIINLFYAVLLGSSSLWAQPYYNQEERFLKANGVWAIADSTGYNFNSTFPSPFSTKLYVTVAGASLSGAGYASVADPVTGELLFYSNGGTCWNKNHEVMPNGTELLGNSLFAGFWGRPFITTQGVCIVPVIDEPGKYYLFSLAAPNDVVYPFPQGTLFYSIVDMSLDNGLGDIVPATKNTVLDADSLGMGMIAIRGERCGEIWLLLNVCDRLRFKAYHITEEGIDPDPVISDPIGAAAWVDSPRTFRTTGIALSPNRDMVAISSRRYGDLDAPNTNVGGGLILCRFNAVTGAVSNPVEVSRQDFVSAAFSPDNTKLYGSRFFGASSDMNYKALVQFDVSVYNTTAIANSEMIIDHCNIYDDRQPLYDMRLYKGKIYGNWRCNASTEIYSLSIIEDPDQVGTASNYQHAALGLNIPGNIGYTRTLPNEVALPLLPDTIGSVVTDTLICLPEDAWESLVLSAAPGYPRYVWNDNSTNATLSITEPGTYWVGYKQENCIWQVDTYKIREVAVGFDLGADTTILFCDHPDSYMPLQVNVPYAEYTWQDGSKESRYEAHAAGIYWVQVEKEGCVANDTITIHTVVPELRDTLLCKGEVINIPMEVSEVPEGMFMQWSTGSTDPAITATDTGMYWVQLIQPPCILADTAIISVEPCECGTRLANAFSPNGDGLNDVFLPVIETGCAVSGYNLHIYSRWGEHIFYSAKPDEGWDGTYKGQPADVGTYFYRVYFEGGRKQTPFQHQGDLTLIR